MMFLTAEILRVVLIVMASYNAAWSIHGPKAIAQGDYSPPSYYLSFVFFASLTAIAYMVRHFISPSLTNQVWVLLTLCLPLVMSAVGVIGHRNGAKLKAKQFYSLYAALPQALAIAELAKYDREAADRLMEESWRLIGDRMLRVPAK